MVKPNSAPIGVKGMINPATTTDNVVAVSAALGRLRNGLPAVLMTKITSVWVASDSMNQPV